MQNDQKNQFKKRLYNFVIKLVEFIDRLPSDNVSRRISDQLLRSGTSILGNYIEVQHSGSKKEFINYFNISLRSANESKMWLLVLKDTHRATDCSFTIYFLPW